MKEIQYHITTLCTMPDDEHPYGCITVNCDEIESGFALDTYNNMALFCGSKYDDIKKELEKFIDEYGVAQSIENCLFEYEKVYLMAEWLSVFMEINYGWDKFEKRLLLTKKKGDDLFDWDETYRRSSES